MDLKAKQAKRLQEILQPEGCGLLLVDLQNDFVSDTESTVDWPENRVDMIAILPAIQQVAAAFRAAGRPVIWSKTHEDLDKRNTAGRDRYLWFELDDPKTIFCVSGTKGAELAIPPVPGDEIVEKYKVSAYSNPRLHELIAEHGLQTMVVAGIKTNRCVAQTVHDLYEAEDDLHVVVLEDCVASDDPAQHAAALKEFKQMYPPVITSAQLFDYWEKAA